MTELRYYGCCDMDSSAHTLNEFTHICVNWRKISLTGTIQDAELGDGEPSPPKSVLVCDFKYCPFCGNYAGLCCGECEGAKKYWRSGAAQEVSPPIPEPGFDEATETRWQNAIYEACKKVVGPENDHLIDGAGCDSGDALDFSIAEIRQAFVFLEDRYEGGDARELRAALPEMMWGWDIEEIKSAMRQFQSKHPGKLPSEIEQSERG